MNKNNQTYLLIALIISVLIVVSIFMILGINARRNNNNTLDNSFKSCEELTATLLGKSENEAINELESKDKIYRVVGRDGEYLPATQDFNEQRINLYIVDGTVKTAGCG